jgi:peptidyl-prolyl cis-trans isomerase C
VKKTMTLLTFIALSAIGAIAQDKPAATSAAPAPSTTATKTSDDPIVVAAGDVAIRKSEFESAIKTLPAEYQQFANGPGRKQFAEDYLRMKMLSAQGFKENLQNDPEVTQQLSLMRENLVANAELQKMEKGIQVTDADLQKAYDANKKEYEQVKANHILIAFKGSPADKGSGARGGELGAFSRGQMVEEFEKAAFAAKAGDVIGPVRTQYGYHVIKVVSHDTTPFTQVKDTLEKNERQRRLKAALDTMKQNANPTFNDAYFAPPAPAMEAPPTAPDAKPAADAKKPSIKPTMKKSDKKQ